MQASTFQRCVLFAVRRPFVHSPSSVDALCPRDIAAILYVYSLMQRKSSVFVSPRLSSITCRNPFAARESGSSSTCPSEAPRRLGVCSLSGRHLRVRNVFAISDGPSLFPSTTHGRMVVVNGQEPRGLLIARGTRTRTTAEEGPLCAPRRRKNKAAAAATSRSFIEYNADTAAGRRRQR